MNATKNLSIANNADFTFSLVYQDADEQPINLTGTSIKMQIKEKPGGTTYWTGTAGISMYGSVTDTLPDTATNLGPVVQLSNVNAVAKNLRVAKVWCENS